MKKPDILKILRSEDSLWAPLIAVVLNILLLYVVSFIARVEFWWDNKEYFPSITTTSDFMRVAVSALRFDTPGILYVNLLYIFLMLFPLQAKERRWWYRMCEGIYFVTNGIALLFNFSDSVYYPFSLRRTTWDLIHEFSNEDNTANVVGLEMWHHRWLVLLLIVILLGVWWLYTSPIAKEALAQRRSRERRGQYYAVMGCSMAIAAVICVAGVRGGWLRHWQLYLVALTIAYIAWRLRDKKIWSISLGIAALALVVIAPIGGWRHRDIRPIAISNANAYAKHPAEVVLILNTPFTLLRTLNDNPFKEPRYFSDSAAMAEIYTPVHTASNDSLPMLKRNVVVIILESFGEEYIDALNDRALGKNSPGFAPFMDSLAAKSMRFAYTFDNGSKSVDAMPSVLASIPRMTKSFILTSSAMQPLDALPALLRRKGYSTAFFHGARTGSMGFDGFARLTGFDKYYGREDFEADKRFGGKDEFDGYWAIWDEPFMQYYAAEMGNLKQPFMTALFTASSHHPFNVPEKYKGKFPEGTLPIHKCIGYTDMALRKFFEAASKQDWYENTIFVITNDHTNQRDHDEYRSDIGLFYGPLLIFDPRGDIASAGVRPGIAQQIDIMPTVLGLLHYPDEYTAYGSDLSAAAKNPTVFGGKGWAISYVNNMYQYVEGDYILQFDGQKSRALYSIDDHLLKNNLLSTRPRQAEQMESRVKAIIQTYMHRRGR